MKLDPADVQLFFDLMLPLQWYVSQQAELLPDIKTFEDYTDSSMDDKIIVRDYLFDHPELIDQFIQDNPNNLETDNLSIIATWKNFIHGDFFIERLLKKYSIFIDDNEKVYAVMGLMIGDLWPKKPKSYGVVAGSLLPTAPSLAWYVPALN